MITVIREIGGCVFVCLGIFIDFHFNWFHFSLHFRFMNFSFHFSAEAIVVRAMLEFQRQQQRLHPLQRQGTPRQVYYYTIFLLLPFLLSSYFPVFVCPQGEMNVTGVCIDTNHSPRKKKQKF